MFNPSREEVRETFFAAWRKYRAGEPLVGIEALALDVILQHPEYHGALSDPERTRDKDYFDESNPFLHMSLHVALEEQLSIDQPPGIVTRFRGLLERYGERHERSTRRSNASPRRCGARSASAARQMLPPTSTALPSARYGSSRAMTGFQLSRPD